MEFQHRTEAAWQPWLPGQLDAERRWLIAPITEMDLAAITQADLTRLVALLVPAGSDRQVLDSI